MQKMNKKKIKDILLSIYYLFIGAGICFGIWLYVCFIFAVGE